MSKPKQTSTPLSYTPASLWRRLGAMLYDSLLLLAVLFTVTAILTAATQGKGLVSNNPLFSSFLLFVCFFFYGWFWVHGGQTLGMRAWRLRVQCPDGRPISWSQALLRFIAAMVSLACAGLGFLWILVDKHQRSWHDRYSESVTAVVSKEYLRNT